MDRKRKNIPAGVRWNVFQRDNFRCVYCGATRRDGATLVVDHGDPFSKGGADDESNYVTARKPCNDGKSAKIVIPQAADAACGDLACTRRGVEYKTHLHADWADAFRQVCWKLWYVAEYSGALGVRTVERCTDPPATSTVRPDFACEFLSREAGVINAVIFPNCDIDRFSDEDKRRMRDAAILGYREPTAIIIGSPWYFWALVVNDRHKGCPAGFELDENLDVAGEFYLAGWYPDECWDFVDPRSFRGLRPHSFSGRGWHMTPGEAAEAVDREARHVL